MLLKFCQPQNLGFPNSTKPMLNVRLVSCNFVVCNFESNGHLSTKQKLATFSVQCIAAKFWRFKYNQIISECTYYALPMHLCNLFNNLRLLVGPNGHLSTKPKLAAFFGRGTICLLLFSFIISKCRFTHILGLFLYFIMNIEVFTVFLFSKKGWLLATKLIFLVAGYLKKMNPGSSGLSYV